MNFKEILAEAIQNKVKIIITGRSGWGKSEMIAQVAEEEGLELVDFRLSEVLPEDIIGIPKVVGEYYEYIPPKWLYEVVNNPEKKYLLFLDEITQGTPEVLNICYKIFDKVTKVGNYVLENVSVVGATNYSYESDYLSDLPEPLKKRACMLQLSHDAEDAKDYLIKKHDLPVSDTLEKALVDSITESNPRSVDKSIELIKNDCNVAVVSEFVGLHHYQSLKSVLVKSDKPGGLSNLDDALYALENDGYVTYESAKYRILDSVMLQYKFGLTDEETRVVEGRMNNLNYEGGKGCKVTLLTDMALDNPELTAEDIMSLSKSNSFNIYTYLTSVKTNAEIFNSQYPAFVKLVGSDKSVFKYLWQVRVLPIHLMREYREHQPWATLRQMANRGHLTESKLKEFAKELQW